MFGTVFSHGSTSIIIGEISHCYVPGFCNDCMEWLSKIDSSSNNTYEHLWSIAKLDCKTCLFSLEKIHNLDLPTVQGFGQTQISIYISCDCIGVFTVSWCERLVTQTA